MACTEGSRQLILWLVRPKDMRSCLTHFRRRITLARAAVFVLAASCETLLAQSTAGSAVACPPPQINTSGWRVFTLQDCGIRLKLPKRYSEKNWAVKVGRPVLRSFDGGPFDRISIAVRPSPLSRLAENKIVRQSDYQGYAECTETIGGREAVVQSFRGGGTMFDRGAQSTTYYAGAVWQLRAGQVLSIGGHVATRKVQEELLAVLRTVEFLL